MALSTFPISSVLLKLAEQEGVNLSVEGIDDVCYGCVISSDKTFVAFLQEHSLPYNWQILDGDPIRVVRRVVNDALTMDHTVVQSECVPAGGAAVSFKRIDQGNLPREIEIQYTDPDRQYATTTRTGRHLGAPLENPGRSIAIDFLISATQARDMAFDTLYRIWAQQLTVSFEHRDVTIEPGDTVHLSCEQGTYILLVTEAIYTASRTTQVSAIVLVSSTEATIPTIDFGSSMGAIGIDILPGEGDNWPPPAGTTSPSQYTSPDIGGTTSPHVGSDLQISAAFLGAGALAADSSISSHTLQGSGTFSGVGRLSADATIASHLLQDSATFAGAGNVIAIPTTLLMPTAKFIGSGQMTSDIILLDTAAWAAAVVAAGGTVSDTRKKLVNDLIAGLKADGIWTKLDRLWLFAAENSQSALVDIVSTSTATLTATNPTFTTDRGYTGNNSGHIDTGYNPYGGGVLNTQNSAHWSFWSVAATTMTASTMACGMNGTNDGTYWYFIGGNHFLRVHDVGDGWTPTLSLQGHFMASRSGSLSRTVYRNASTITTDTTNASQALENIGNYWVLACDSIDAPTNLQCAMYSVGGSLSGGSDATNFYNRLRTYMTAVGVP